MRGSVKTLNYSHLGESGGPLELSEHSLLRTRTRENLENSHLSSFLEITDN